MKDSSKNSSCWNSVRGAPHTLSGIAKGEEIIPLEDEVKVQFEEVEEEDSEILDCEEDFEDFYCPDVIEDTTTTSIPTTIVVSTNQRATKVLERMVVEKRLLDLLSLMVFQAYDATPEVLVVSKPPIPTPPLPPT